jgi:hypothetical protein
MAVLRFISARENESPYASSMDGRFVTRDAWCECVLVHKLTRMVEGPSITMTATSLIRDERSAIWAEV